MATGSELEEVQGAYGAGLNTGNVAESLNELLAVDLGVVDDERTTSLAVTAATELALTGAELLGVLGLLEIGASADSLEESQGGGSAGEGTGVEEGRVDNERDLSDGHDLVATCHQERSGGRGSQGGAGSITPGIVSTWNKACHVQSFVQ